MSGNPLRQINNIYGYVRVSTDEQVKSGISLETQMQQIREFVKEKYNREVDQFFADEGVSGTHAVLERPASRDMTDVIDRHDVVICTRLDRLSRSSSDLLGLIPVLQDIGITLYFCEQFGEMPVVYPDAAKSKGLDSKFDMNSMAHRHYGDGLSRRLPRSNTRPSRIALQQARSTGPHADMRLAALRPMATAMLRKRLAARPESFLKRCLKSRTFSRQSTSSRSAVWVLARLPSRSIACTIYRL
jgi:DNA invertase Pin-like site-specific DNA recombinase